MSDTAPERSQSSFFTPPSLPKGGGVVSAGGGMLSMGGADGSAGWSIPLPVFTPPARSLAPELTLVYSSNAGNSEFGIGWQLPVASIRRDTRHGTPHYSDDDRLTGPGGSQLLQAGNARSAGQLPFGSGSRQSYQITTWYEKNTGPAVTYEWWLAEETEYDDERNFWVQYSPDGSMSLYGYSPGGKIGYPRDPGRTAEWHLEETVSPRGEHIVWSRITEDLTNEAGRNPYVQNAYLHTVYWANTRPARYFLIPAGEAGPFKWQCYMEFDYGRRTTPEESEPPSVPATGGTWSLRADPFSHWRYGLEVRTRRLCKEILLFHNKKMTEEPGRFDFTLVSRLRLHHEVSPEGCWLSAVQQLAYENGEVRRLPPVEFERSRPAGLPGAGDWVRRTDLDGFSPPYWQMADLYGEGLPGLLYQDGGAWWYRAPERDAGGVPDGVTWGAARRLSQVPPSGAGSRLTDLDADGHLEWLITSPGINGSFTLSPDGRWSGFIPFSALPTELMSEHALLADLNGGGHQDLVMMGPRSLRLWPGRGREGWGHAETVPVSDSTRLPVGKSEKRLVAFSDIPGGGQSHLVEITASTVTCWPSLGRGRLGTPYTLEGFSVPPDTFSPDRVWLADTDGSGFPDILYLEQGGIRVFINQSGNAFRDAGLIPPPEGLTPDDTWHLQVADIQGLGTVSLLLTVPHMTPRSWLLSLNTEKPWLMKEVSNNMGSRTLLEYRSSAQGWLDEKAALLAAGQPAVSHLPFPVHALSRVTQISDITGLSTGSETRYFRGVWDAREREFCGFCRLIQTDTHDGIDSDSGMLSPPLETRTWFLTGLEEHDQTTPGSFEGAAGFPLRTVYLTRWDEDTQTDLPYEPGAGEKIKVWLALRGVPVRTEVYGRDDSDRADIPFSITHQRWQVRAIPVGHEGIPLTLATPVESLATGCERIPSDPVITQSVILGQDKFGSVLKSATISYPRQAAVAGSDYPDTLPEGLLAACRDPQQDEAWLTLTRSTVHNLDRLTGGNYIHVTGLPDSTRTDVLRLTRADIPADGFCVENLSAPDSVLSAPENATLSAWSKTLWRGNDGETLTDIPDREALVAYTETAMLDAPSLSAFSEALTGDELMELLSRGGYHAHTLPEDEKAVWTGRHNFTTYHDESGFWLPRTVRDSELTGETTLAFTQDWLTMQSVTDAAGLTTTFEKYDWRFMTPTVVHDANDNRHYAELDALGRVTHTRFRGTEFSPEADRVVETGYNLQAFTPPADVEAALNLRTVPVATAHTTVADSWMPLQRNAQGEPVPDQRTGELALRRWLKENDLPPPDLSQEREPPHVISLQTDRYDSDTAQQVRVSVTLSDGAGRPLQTSVLMPEGEAFIRTAEGGLATDGEGKAVTESAAVRWAVSGRTEYDNKGQPVRVWQPFYLNDWRPVSDDTARDGIYADTHFYDAAGRVYRVVTAAGYERRTQYYPWFTVAEDENDTAHDVLARHHTGEQ